MMELCPPVFEKCYVLGLVRIHEKRYNKLGILQIVKSRKFPE